MTHTDQPIKVFRLEKDTNWILVFGLTAWLVVWVIMVGFMGFGLVTSPTRFPELWLGLVAIIGFGLFMLRTWLWQVRGVEVISAFGNRIEISRLGSFAYGKPSIAIQDLDGIGASSDDQTLGWMKWWGFEGGTIHVDFLGRSIRCGQDLSLGRARSIARELNAVYQDRQVERESS